MSDDILEHNSVSGYAKQESTYFNIVKTSRKTSKAGKPYNACFVNLTELDKAIEAGAASKWTAQDGSTMVSLLANSRPAKTNVAAKTREAIEAPDLGDSSPF